VPGYRVIWFRVVRFPDYQVRLVVAIKNVKDLRVYQLALELLEVVYQTVYKIPHLKLRTQLTKSAEAIAPLVSEGFSKRRNPKETTRFYEMAMAESDEVLTHLEEAVILSKTLRTIPRVKCEILLERYTTLSKQLNKLFSAWKKFSA